MFLARSREGEQRRPSRRVQRPGALLLLVSCYLCCVFGLGSLAFMYVPTFLYYLSKSCVYFINIIFTHISHMVIMLQVRFLTVSVGMLPYVKEAYIYATHSV